MGESPQANTRRVPRRNPTAAFRIFEGQATIVLPDGSYIKVLNEVGSRIWELMDGTRDIPGLASVIAGEFEITPQEAERDVREFVDDLGRNNML